MRTSFHHQPEARHPKFFSYPQAAGRLPHLYPRKRTLIDSPPASAKCQHQTSRNSTSDRLHYQGRKRESIFTGKTVTT